MVSGSVDKTAIIWKKTGDQVNKLGQTLKSICILLASSADMHAPLFLMMMQLNCN